MTHYTYTITILITTIGYYKRQHACSQPTQNITLSVTLFLAVQYMHNSLNTTKTAYFSPFHFNTSFTLARVHLVPTYW